MKNTFAFLLWIAAFACAVQGCEATLDAGGWHLWWVLVGWRAAKMLLSHAADELWRTAA